VAVFAGGVGFLALDAAEGIPTGTPGEVPAIVHAGLVGAQALALLLRGRALPVGFVLAVAFDLVILATTGGELGIGALGVFLAAYLLARHGERRTAYLALAAAAAATTIVGGAAMAVWGSVPLLGILAAAITRVLLLYVLPAGIAEYLLGRERLVVALRERAEFAERERRTRLEAELRSERTGLARELHDIAGHHLSGIIVSAQAASTLLESDPARSRELLRTLQDDARTTLADLRRTVGLLRSDELDAAGDGPGGSAPSPVPSLEQIASLVGEARSRGQEVEYTVTGDSRGLGPLAETAAYRMVQESLANAARHAPGAGCSVTVVYSAAGVTLVVRSDPPGGDARSTIPTAVHRRGMGFGLAGMEERAELIGAELSVGPAQDGSWTNRLTIPAPLGRSES
jgi:signal transduction histidine kinase